MAKKSVGSDQGNRPQKVAMDGTILAQEQVAAGVYRIELQLPSLSALAAPGQFVQLRLLDGAHLLRRPLGIAERSPLRGSVTLFYRVVGSGTQALARLKKGATVHVLGPLGHGFSTTYARPLLVGGGMGLSPLLSCAQAQRGACDVLMGGKTEGELFWRPYYEPYVKGSFFTTDDGSFGTKGFVTTLLPDVLEKGDYDVVLVCGPEVMMRGVAKIAQAHGLPCEVSLERRMACGLGACLSCSIDTTSGERRKVCKDGPVFRAEEVFS